MKKLIALLLTLLLFFTPFTPLLQSPLIPKAYAETCIYYLEDGLGNVRFITSNTGSNVKSYIYDPFGSIITSSGPLTGNRYQFNTQYFDTDPGTYYLRARYYDPMTGRFISRDPVKGNLTNPQSQNPYAYTLNNPVNLSDPSGEFVETVWDVANIVYDIYTCDWTALGVDTAAAFIPFVPAGITKVGKVANVVSDAKRFTPDQSALVDIAKEAKRTGVTNEDANTLLKWADETGLVPALDHRDTTHWVGGDHIRVGPVNHIPIK